MALITRRQTLGGLAATIALPELALPELAFAARDGLRIATRSGVVRGRMGDGVRVFTGIPYGTAARFAPPRPARAWTGEWDATRPARATPQPPGMDPLPATQAEDCLQLNVWAPAAPGRYPVMVFVHGGSNETGWSGWDVIAGNRFAAHGVVCVTLNYRLGALGFVELGHILGRAYAGSGNNGLRDLVLGLRWVQDNIAAFGGNPRAVTLAGESSGARNVCALMGLPAADRLYARAMVFSGGAQTVHTPAEAALFANAVVARLGGADRLLVAPFPALVDAQVRARRGWPRNLPFRPTVDGTFLPQVPLARIVAGRAPRVPLLAGSNANESRLFLNETQAARPLWSQSVSNEPMTRVAALNRAYSRAFPELTDAQRHWRLLTAEEYAMPTLRLAEAQAQRGAPVWRYRLAWPAPGGPYKGHSPHVLDLPLTFDHVTLPAMAQMFGLSSADQPIAEAWHEAIVAFVKGGAPASPGIPAWPRFDTQARATLVFDRLSTVENDPDGAERALWLQNPAEPAGPALRR